MTVLNITKAWVAFSSNVKIESHEDSKSLFFGSQGNYENRKLQNDVNALLPTGPGPEPS